VRLCNTGGTRLTEGNRSIRSMSCPVLIFPTKVTHGFGWYTISEDGRDLRTFNPTFIFLFNLFAL